MKRKSSIFKKSNLYGVILFITFGLMVGCEDLTDNLSTRDNILDTWKCTERDGANNSKTFLIEVGANSTNLNGILIYNINQLGDNVFVEATVTGNTISISSQEVPGFRISGNGTIESGYEEINLSYSVEDIDSGENEYYTAVCKKP